MFNFVREFPFDVMREFFILFGTIDPSVNYFEILAAVATMTD